MKNLSKYISIGAVAVLMMACNTDKTTPGYTFMDDMYIGPAMEPYAAEEMLESGMEAQKPVEGTVPRGYTVYPYEDNNEGYELAKAEWKMPAEFKTEKALEEGKELYGIFCTHCHGDKGDGQGHLVKIEKFPPVPSYDSRDLTAGSMYHVIMYGRGLMGSHASQLSNEERWKIIRYVQKLRGDDKVEKSAEGAEEAQVAAAEEQTEEQS